LFHPDEVFISTLQSADVRIYTPRMVLRVPSSQSSVVDELASGPGAEVTHLKSQLAGLRHADEVQRTFHLLATSALTSHDVVQRMAEIAGCPVVLENLAHHVMAAATGGAARFEGLLTEWESRSRRVATAGGAPGWLATAVGARGQVWGWVVLLTPTSPSVLHEAVAYHGANALAVVQLIGRTPGPIEQQAHQRILTDLVKHPYATSREGHERTEALGVPTAGRRLQAVIVRVDPSPEVVAAAMDAARAAGAPAIVGEVGEALGLLICDDEREAPGVLLARATARVGSRFAEVEPEGPTGAVGAPAADRAVRIGVGPVVARLDQVLRSFVEADDAARAGTPPAGRPYATASDIDLRGVLHLLRDESHVQRFVERELGPILAHDARHETNYLQTLVAYLEAGGNKSGAAARSHLSRATFYKHLDQIGDVIGRDLDDPEVRTALHIAVLTAKDLRTETAQGSSSSSKWLTRNGFPSGSRSTAWSAP
jgi:purine catabolism regulator